MSEIKVARAGVVLRKRTARTARIGGSNGQRLY